jgi:hypothetical protein
VSKKAPETELPLSYGDRLRMDKATAPVDPWKTRALEAEAKAAFLEAQLLTLKRQMLLKEIDPEGKLAALEADIQRAMNTAHELAKQAKVGD